MGATRRRPVRLLRQLGIYGLDHLDPVVLAALADARPLLLIGPHGTAKSELLNRLAARLGLRHRHYNASLLSFDDLMGYPVPDRETGKLEFLETPASIWGAESVFLDEISRCRPETANKLFSIVHEARIQGLELPDLRYRWAAMNPPPPPDKPWDPGNDNDYTGSLPLDPALADRFAWVVEVPAFTDLPVAERLAIVASGGTAPAEGDGPDLPRLVEATKTARKRLPPSEREWAVSWVEALLEPLGKAGLPISGRRAVMLRDSVLWVRAASRVLRRTLPLRHAAFRALQSGLPHRANGAEISVHKLSAAHRAASEAAGTPRSSPLRELRATTNPVRKVALALSLPGGPRSPIPDSERSAVVIDSLAELPQPERWAVCLLASRHPGIRHLDATALELMAEPLALLLAFASAPCHRMICHRNSAPSYGTTGPTPGSSTRAEDPARELGLDSALLDNLLTLLKILRTDYDPEKVSEAFSLFRSFLKDTPHRRVEA